MPVLTVTYMEEGYPNRDSTPEIAPFGLRTAMAMLMTAQASTPRAGVADSAAIRSGSSWLAAAPTATDVVVEVKEPMRETVTIEERILGARETGHVHVGMCETRRAAEAVRAEFYAFFARSCAPFPIAGSETVVGQEVALGAPWSRHAVESRRQRRTSRQIGAETRAGTEVAGDDAARTCLPH